MKLAISNIAWNDEHEYYYQVMQQNGFTGLEIGPTKFSDNPYDHLDIIQQVSTDLSNQYGLNIVSMQSLLFGTTDLNLFHTVEQRNNLMGYLKKAIVYAEVAKCPVLVFGNPKNRIYNDYTNDYPIAVEFFRELGEFAVEHNTHLCIEPNPKDYGTNFINTLNQASQLVDDVNSVGFKMIIDSSTMLLNNDKVELIHDVIHNVCHMHLSMPFLKSLNSEYPNHHAWVHEFIAMIKASEYQHYLSIEMANISRDDIKASIELLANLAN